jgi:cytochrome bd-type quinol oxidase subunit 2
MRFLPGILMVVLYIYCWIEIAQSDPRQVRMLSRAMWAAIVLIPFAGAGAWLVYGRPNGEQVVQTAPKPKPRVVAPDDDPDFLRSLRPPKPPKDEGPAV